MGVAAERWSWSNLTHVVDFDIGVRRAAQLAEALKSNTTLQSIDLSGMMVGCFLSFEVAVVSRPLFP